VFNHPLTRTGAKTSETVWAGKKEAKRGNNDEEEKENPMQKQSE